MSMLFSSYTIDEMDAYAQEEEGVCLTRDILDNWKKLLWKCKSGHKFNLLASQVRQGAWCPQCEAIEKGTQKPAKKKTWSKETRESRAAKQEKQLERLRIISVERGGKCLSDVYINNETRMKFGCSTGHVWETIPSSILRKNKVVWCPHCAGKAPLTLEYMREVAQRNGGKCLSDSYIKLQEKLVWECSEGHVWEANGASVVHNLTWCAKCSGNARLTLEEMHTIAKSKYAKCLSTAYINNRTKLKWECREGHHFEMHANHIKLGSWCPQCARIRKPVGQ